MCKWLAGSVGSVQDSLSKGPGFKPRSVCNLFFTSPVTMWVVVFLIWIVSNQRMIKPMIKPKNLVYETLNDLKLAKSANFCYRYIDWMTNISENQTMTLRWNRIQDTIHMNREWFVEILSECQSALIRLRRCFARRVIRIQADRLTISESL